jgi:hypothetical protein
MDKMPACTEVSASDGLPISGSTQPAIGAGSAMDLPPGLCSRLAHRHRAVPSASIGARSITTANQKGREPADKVPA